MKSLISTLALAGAVLGASSASLASDTATPAQVPIAAAGTSFVVVDKATGQVLGELISIGGNARVIAALAERARTALPTIADQQVKVQPRTAAEWQQFWSAVLPGNGP